MLGAVVPQVCSRVLHTFLADGVVVPSLAAASTRGPHPVTVHLYTAQQTSREVEAERETAAPNM